MSRAASLLRHRAGLKYRNRATAWPQRAESLHEGREREACLTLAEGYVRLAELIEAQDAPAAVELPKG